MSRSRAGCATCKRRHRKCDETKPTCRACKAQNLKCEGYDVILRWGSGIASRGKFAGASQPTQSSSPGDEQAEPIPVSVKKDRKRRTSQVARQGGYHAQHQMNLAPQPLTIAARSSASPPTASTDGQQSSPGSSIGSLGADGSYRTSSALESPPAFPAGPMLPTSDDVLLPSQGRLTFGKRGSISAEQDRLLFQECKSDTGLSHNIFEP